LSEGSYSDMGERGRRRTNAPLLLPVAILAGGLATRLGDHARHKPKALAPVAGEPFIFHQLRLLAAHGARRVVLCVGHLGDQIVDAVGDGTRFGIEVMYSFDGAELVGTAGALRRALHLLGDEFLVTYGDAYLRIDHGMVQEAFRSGGLPGLMTVLRNDGKWGPSNAVFEDGRVIAYNKRTPPAGAHWIDYGLLAFEARVFEGSGPGDLSDVCCELASRGSLAGLVTHERFYEIGTPGALADLDELLRGKPTSTHSRLA
jgi:N-acetyl-alpha-D-muramate 1-phosphate uridylyltransferase